MGLTLKCNFKNTFFDSLTELQHSMVTYEITSSLKSLGSFIEAIFWGINGEKPIFQKKANIKWSHTTKKDYLDAHFDEKFPSH